MPKPLSVGSGTILAAFILFAPSPVSSERRFTEDPWHRELAIHWSPFFYQASEDNYDIPTNFDFDGDWYGYNNWQNAYWYRNNFQARVYYSFQETTGHYFLSYFVFHPRDTKDLFGHENDLEGVRLIIRKDGSQYGTFWFYVTFGHGDLFTTASPEWINGSHAAAYIEDKGHGIKPWNDGHFPADCGGMGIWYAGRGAETPEHCNDRDVSMDLIPFLDTLFATRFGEPYRDTGTLVSGAFFGLRYGGDDGWGACKANPPWNWFGDSGSWFMDPRAHYVCCSSEEYLHNEYLWNRDSGYVYGC